MKSSRQRKGIEDQRGKEEERILGGGDNPAHTVYNVYVLLCFVKITGRRNKCILIMKEKKTRLNLYLFLEKLKF